MVSVGNKWQLYIHCICIYIYRGENNGFFPFCISIEGLSLQVLSLDSHMGHRKLLKMGNADNLSLAI